MILIKEVKVWSYLIYLLNSKQYKLALMIFDKKGKF
jgi:hypothetical protein